MTKRNAVLITYRDGTLEGYVEDWPQVNDWAEANGYVFDEYHGILSTAPREPRVEGRAHTAPTAALPKLYVRPVAKLD